MNKEIRAREIRLVGPEGEQVGIVPLQRALDLAAEVGLDLVEVAANATPPVCRLMDYGRFKYEASQKAREARRNQQQVVVKQINFRVGIDSHDYETKRGHITRFLSSGFKVKASVWLRGRGQSRPEQGVNLLNALAGELGELAVVESAPSRDGRNIIMMLAPPKKPQASGNTVVQASGSTMPQASGDAVTQQPVTAEAR
nr:translation initiation factor IF-3 [Actinorhabdospora filicis]